MKTRLVSLWIVLAAVGCRNRDPVIGGPPPIDEMSPREVESGAIENLDDHDARPGRVREPAPTPPAAK